MSRNRTKARGTMLRQWQRIQCCRCEDAQSSLPSRRAAWPDQSRPPEGQNSDGNLNSFDARVADALDQFLIFCQDLVDSGNDLDASGITASTPAMKPASFDTTAICKNGFVWT